MNTKRYSNFILGIIFGGIALVSCEESFNVGNDISEDTYLRAIQNVAGIRNEQGKSHFTTIDVIEDKTVADFYIQLSKNASETADAVLTIGDQSLVEQYNAENGTSYQPFPADKAAIDGDGLAVLLEGTRDSEPIRLTINTDNSILKDVTYALPLQVNTTNDALIPGSTHFVFIKNCMGRKFASSEKPSGIKLFSCLEVGNTNPLFHKSFMLKNSGLPLFDVVILFSTCIVYDKNECRILIENKPGTSGTINSDIVQQLHDYGIKVIVSILGSDNGGVAHLTNEGCKTFAQEIANFCEAYDLDGVFFDDEYTGNTNYPGMIGSSWGSRERAARLCYETKKAMPDKLVTCYIYGNTYGFYSDINGMAPGEFVDYAISDYGSWDDASLYKGMTNKQVAPCSANFAMSYARWVATRTNLQRVRNEGYGAYMLYCLTFHVREVWDKELEQLGNIARYLYDDELVFTGEKPECDW